MTKSFAIALHSLGKLAITGDVHTSTVASLKTWVNSRLQGVPDVLDLRATESHEAIYWARSTQDPGALYLTMNAISCWTLRPDIFNSLEKSHAGLAYSILYRIQQFLGSCVGAHTPLSIWEESKRWFWYDCETEHEALAIACEEAGISLADVQSGKEDNPLGMTAEFFSEDVPTWLFIGEPIPDTELLAISRSHPKHSKLIQQCLNFPAVPADCTGSFDTPPLLISWQKDRREWALFDEFANYYQQSGEEPHPPFYASFDPADPLSVARALESLDAWFDIARFVFCQLLPMIATEVQ